MKLKDFDSINSIKDWTDKGINHIPDESQTGRFVREIIPYMEELEKTVEDLTKKVKLLEQRTSGIIQNNIKY